MTPALSPWDVPPPVLFNAWKHHAGALRYRIASCTTGGEESLAELAGSLVVIGTQLMDLYTGVLVPAEIGRQVLVNLEVASRLAPEPYRAWVAEQGGYGMTTLLDGSEWCLRAADEERYIHVHPGRWVTNTCRVRANVLKTAVMVLAHVAVHGGDPLERTTVNHVRQTYLSLEPIGHTPDTDRGLGEIVTLLREDENAPGG
jgi:hypothetical protein